MYKAPNNALLHVPVIALSFVQIPEQRVLANMDVFTVPLTSLEIAENKALFV
jgi:hypothetical protein